MGTSERDIEVVREALIAAIEAWEKFKQVMHETVTPALLELAERIAPILEEIEQPDEPEEE